jgi:hypothetical protein
MDCAGPAVVLRLSGTTQAVPAGRIIVWAQQMNPAEKLFPFIRITVKPQNKKYFAFPEGQISGSFLAIPSWSEGRRPSSRTLDGLRWTLRLRKTSATAAYGKSVWS